MYIERIKYVYFIDWRLKHLLQIKCAFMKTQSDEDNSKVFQK